MAKTKHFKGESRRYNSTPSAGAKSSLYRGDPYHVEVQYLNNGNVFKEDNIESANSLGEGKKYFDRAVRNAFSEDYGQDEVWIHLFKQGSQIKFKSVKQKLGNLSSADENFDAATKVSEGFHGRKSLYVEDIIEIERYRTKLAHLGDLVELEILDISGRHVIPISFAVHDSEEHVSVASTPDRNQLIFSGGNQGIELESFPDLTDNEKCKDYVRIGEVFSISYFTDKHHLEGPKYQKDGTEYIHQFGEEDGGVRPELMYDTLNQRMILVGGSYEVRDEGIYN